MGPDDDPASGRRGLIAMDDWSSPGAEALSEELLGFVKPELRPGERLLWAATEQARPPDSGRPPWVVTYVAFGFVGFGLALFYAIFGPLRQRLLIGESLIIMTGLVASLVGIIAALIAGGCWLDRWVNVGGPSMKMYALTDSRALIWVPQKATGAVEVHTIARGSIKAIHRLEYPDGSGDVKFDYSMDQHRYGVSGFEGVSDVRDVEDLTRRTLIESARTHPS
jgi:hypothetical protein